MRNKKKFIYLPLYFLSWLNGILFFKVLTISYYLTFITILSMIVTLIIYLKIYPKVSKRLIIYHSIYCCILLSPILIFSIKLGEVMSYGEVFLLVFIWIYGSIYYPILYLITVVSMKILKKIITLKMISDEEASQSIKVLIKELSKTKEWKNLEDLERLDLIFTILDRFIYYKVIRHDKEINELLFYGRINENIYHIPKKIREEYSIEITKIYYWIQFNKNNKDFLVNIEKYCSIMLLYIEKDIQIFEQSYWNKKEVKNKDFSKDITTYYVFLKTIQIYENQEDKNIVNAVNTAYTSMDNKQIKNWNEFSNRVVGEKLCTQEEIEINLKD